MAAAVQRLRFHCEQAEEERRAQKAARKTGALPAAESDDEDAEAADEVAAVGDDDDAGEGGETSIAALLAQSGALAEPAVPLTFRGTLADLYAATQPAAEPRLRAIVFAVDARDPIGWRTPLLEEEQVDAQKIIALTRAGELQPRCAPPRASVLTNAMCQTSCRSRRSQHGKRRLPHLRASPSSPLPVR